ncbi:uncharacterized protein LOC126378257 [Pectinophora gossypiella]|nr:uncharacterized protein LOC126378257 [Pectinophora gossypiella]
MEYYKNKIRKYELRRQGAGQQPNQSPSGYTPCMDYSEEGPIIEAIPVDPVDDTVNDSDDSFETIPSTTADPVLDPSSGAEETVPNNPEIENVVPEIDPELLQALGEVTEGTPEFGEKIHENLAQLWAPLLKKGLSKESKEKLTKDYLIPENCKLFQAPKLNAEITAAISELARNRDKKMMATQQQLGIGLTAVNRAMTILLTSDNKVKAMKYLSDGCRILCDLHQQQGYYRTKCITPCLDKSFCQVIQDVERDETLFGAKLSDQIKASKAIERQGLQIKKSNPKQSTCQTTAGRPASVPGNWAGPARSTNRGGRGGNRRGGHAPQHNAPRAPPPQAQTSTQQQAVRMRAPPQQQQQQRR